MQDNSMLNSALNKKRLAFLLTILILSTGLLFWLQNKSELEPYRLITAPLSPGEVLINQAQVTFRDSRGANYGPVLSGRVSTTIIVGQASFDLRYTRENIENFQGEVNIVIFQVGTSNIVANLNVNASSGSQITIPAPSSVTTGQRYDIVLRVPYQLSRKLSNIQWPPQVVLDFGRTFDGDLNRDDIINTLDWSNMKANWRGASVAADLNKDGIVNSIDWGLMNKNWGQRGEA